MISVEINGEAKEIEAATLDALLRELGLGEAVVATALNAHFVPKEARAGQPVKAGDRIEILAPMQGG